jgi:GDP/UDP-N,N'-diacetylbacillosamine 2-epimerase (hydrolysing)
MKKIAFLSTSRADLGLLTSSIIQGSKIFEVSLFVYGDHASNTELMEKKNIKMHCVKDAASFNNTSDLGSYIAHLIKSVQSFLDSEIFDCAVIMGDRWEILPVAHCLLMNKIPIAHMSGGEMTYGVIDENIRHAVTKISSLHFSSTEIYAKNIRAMGEEIWRVHNVGEPGLDEIHDMSFLSLQEIDESLGIQLNNSLPTFLITVHPETRSLSNNSELSLNELFKVLVKYPNFNKVFTAPGVEEGSGLIKSQIMSFVENQPRCWLFNNMGRKLYLSMMKNAKLVVGNSSSGIIEAPSIGCSTVNIGNRQLGRVRSNSVIDCKWESRSIHEAIEIALKCGSTSSMRNPYDINCDGENTSRFIHLLNSILGSRTQQELLNKKLDYENA